MRSGGNIDMDKVSKIILTELRDGLLGRLTLETPEMMRQELVELAVIREKKATKKLKRKKNWKEKAKEKSS